jgi:hypothetical protein
MGDLENMSAERWHRCLAATFRTVSETPACTRILRDMSGTRLQIVITDRPEMSYWEEYDGGRVIPHLGLGTDCVVEISTTFRVLLATLLDRLSIMEAAADEVYELRGDTTVLMKCANMLPYVMAAFSQAVALSEMQEA